MIDYRSNAVWSVYIHITPNNKYYIGITSQNPHARWGLNGNGYKTQLFYRAIQKYGWENIEHIVLAQNLTKTEAKEFEIYLIQKLKSNESQYGYNITNGGEGQTGCISHKRLDLSNKKFGRLTVISPSQNRYYPPHNRSMLKWICQCECGNKVEVLAANLLNGNTRSCGCLCDDIRHSRSYNKADFMDSYVIMYTNKNEKILLDTEDYDYVKQYTWYISRNMVVSDVRENNERHLYILKNMLYGFNHSKSKKVKVKHNNGNPLDFRRKNLELIIPDNCNYDEYIYFLKSDITGIYWDKRACKWVVRHKNKSKYFNSIYQAEHFIKCSAFSICKGE